MRMGDVAGSILEALPRTCAGTPGCRGRTRPPPPPSSPPAACWPRARTLRRTPGARGLHSSTSQLNLSRVCHTQTSYAP
jgi:hypothetical protein